MNPAMDALESASAVARALQSRGAEPMPVSAIVAVGPYAGKITQPTGDLHRGVRVVHPSTTTMLAAVRELSTYERSCGVEPARHLLRALDERAGELAVADLVSEGFPDSVSPDLASANTLLIPKVADEQQAPLTARGVLGWFAGLPRRTRLVALAAAILVLFAVVVSALLLGRRGSAESGLPQDVDGVTFVRTAADQDDDCAEHSAGEVRAWFEQQECAGLSRQVFDVTAAGRRAAVAITVVDLPGRARADELRKLLNTPGSGGVTDLVAEGESWPGAPRGFDGAARAVQQTGRQLRIARTAWSAGRSAPQDVELRVLAERGLRLSTAP